MTMSSPVDLDSRTQRTQPGDDPGDPVGFLVPQLARAADDGPAARLRGREAEHRDLVDGRGGLRRRRPRSPRSSDDRTTRSAIGSPAPSSGRAALVDRRRPSVRSRSMTARRVGLTPTPRNRSSASGWIAPATSQNAAAEGSPGTTSSRAATVWPPSISTTAPPSGVASGPHGDAARPEHPLGVIPRRDRFADPGRALGRAAGQQDRRLHLRRRHRRRPVDRAEAPPGGHDQRRPLAGHALHARRPSRGAARRCAPSAVAAARRRRRGSHRIGCAGDDAREQPHARAGVAAVEDRRGLAKASGAVRRDDVVDVARPRPAVRVTRAPSASTIPAVERTSAPSPAPLIRDVAVREEREHQRPVADRLVAGQPELARQPRRARRPVGVPAGVVVVVISVLREPAGAGRVDVRPDDRAGAVAQVANVLVDGHELAPSALGTRRG